MIGLYELPVVINRNSEAMLGKRVTLQLGTSTPKCIRLDSLIIYESNILFSNGLQN